MEFRRFRYAVGCAAALAALTALAQHPDEGLYRGTVTPNFGAAAGMVAMIDGAGNFTDGGGLRGTVTSGGAITFTEPNVYNFASGTVTDGAVSASTPPENPVYGFYTYTLILTRIAADGPWTRITNGLPAGLASPVIGAGAGGTVYLGAGGNGIYRSTDDGVSWSQVAGAGEVLPPRALFRMDSGRILRGGETASWQNRVGNPVFTSDDGSSWTEATDFTPAFAGPGGTAGFIDFTAHSDGNVYAADLLGNGAWRSNDGRAWTAVSEGLPTYFGSAKKTNGITSQGGALIAATDLAGFYRSTDNGANWAAANTGVTSPSQAKELKTMPDGSAAYGLNNGQLWKTTDGGASWTDAAPNIFKEYGGLIGSASAVAVAPGAVYVYATNGQIGESTDGGATWVRLDTANLPPVDVGGFDQYFYHNNGVLFVGLGFGLYRADLASVDRIPFPPTQVTVTTSGAANPGGTVTLTAEASGGTPPFSFRWFLGDDELPGQSADTLILADVQFSDAGDYTVEAYNDGGSATSQPVAVSVLPVSAGFPELRFISEIDNPNFWKATKVAPYGSKLLVGGPQNTPNLYLLDADGTPDPAWQLDPVGFPRDISNNTRVDAIAFQSDGKILIGGAIYSTYVDNVGNILEGATFMRLLPDGTVDPSFVLPPTGTTRGFHVLDDDSFWVFGGLSSNVNTDDDFRWDVLGKMHANGSHDTGYQSPYVGTQSYPTDIAIDPGTGEMYITGYLGPDVNNRQHRIVRFAPDGSFDGSYEVNHNGLHNRLAVQENGNLLVGGGFDTINGETAWGLARLLRDGTLDPDFEHGEHLQQYGFPSQVHDVVVLPDGSIVVAGQFDQFDGFVSNRVMRLIGDPVDLAFVTQPRHTEANQGTDVTFAVETVGTTPVTYQWRKNGVPLPGETGAQLVLTSVQPDDQGTYDVIITNASGNRTSRGGTLTILGAPEILSQSQAQLLVAGSDATLEVVARGEKPLAYQWRKDGEDLPGQASPTLELTAVDADDSGAYTCVVSTRNFGSVESDPIGVAIVGNPAGMIAGLGAGPGTSNINISRVLVRPAGGWYVGGNFANYDGVARTFAVAVDEDGALIPGFDLGDDPANTWYNPSYNYLPMAVAPDGGLFLGGRQFNNWRTVRKYRPDGSLDGDFGLPQINVGDLYDLAVQPDGKVLVAAQNSLTRLNTDGSEDTSFTKAISGPVYRVLVLADGRIAAGGSFMLVTGSDTRFVAILNPDGTPDTTFSTFGSRFQSGVVYDLLEEPDGSLLAGGNFTNTTPGGHTYTHLARLGPDGTVDTAFAPNPGGSVLALAPGRDGVLYVGGAFSTFGGEAYKAIAAIDPASGALDPRFVPDPGASSIGGSVNCLSLSPATGRLAVGGRWTFFNNTASNSFTILNGIPVPVGFLTQPQGLVTDPDEVVTLTVDTTGLAAVSLQWQKDGIDIPGATAPTLTINNAQPADSATYTAVATNLFGTATSDPARVIVRDAPVFLSQPTDMEVTRFEDLQLTPEVEGLPDIVYQWYRNGVEIDGAEDRSLTITGATFADAGLYTLEAANALGTTASDPIAVRVTIPRGKFDTAFGNGLQGLISGTVSAVTALPDGRILLGGAFTAFTTPTRYGLLMLEADGTVDDTFTSGFTGQPQGVYDLQVDADDRILVGGNFTSYGPDREDVRWLIRINADGSRDATFTPVFIGSGSGTVPGVKRIIVLPDGKLLVGGKFETVNGDGQAQIVRLHPDGSIDTTFSSPLGNAGSSNNGVLAIARGDDGTIFIGGQLGSNHYIARLSDAGALDATFRGNANNRTISAVSPPVYDLVAMPDGKVLAGNIGTYGSGLNLLNPDGTRDATIDWQKSGSANAVRRTPAGRILVFSNDWREMYGMSSDDGSIDPGFETTVFGGTSNYPLLKDLAFDPHGRILTVGSFTAVNGTTRSSFARLDDGAKLPEIIATTASQNIVQDDTITLDVVAAGTGTLTYQWYLGDSGDTTSPVDGATDVRYTTLPLDATGKFWVRVSDGLASDDSDTIVIGVIAPPAITVDPVEVELAVFSPALDRTALLQGVAAEDYEATDLTDRIVITGAVDTDTVGTYTILYDVTDDGGRKAARVSRTYRITDTVPPTITVDPLEIITPVGKARDPRTGLSAVDAYDGDLTAAVTLAGDPLDITTPGTYSVTYDVADAAGNPAATVTRVYRVVRDVFPPVVTVAPAMVDLTVGDPLDPPVDVGVTATDLVDGDITNDILVGGAIPDGTTAGIFVLTYRVTDFSGNRSRIVTRTYRIRNVAATDTDHDGLDDDWERAHFGGFGDARDLRWRGTDDADGDGDDNLREYRYGTPPRAYTIPIRPGWNVVSLYHLPAQRSVADLLRDADGDPVYDGPVWVWNNRWERYVDATEFDAHNAVWLWAPKAAEVTIQLP